MRRLLATAIVVALAALGADVAKAAPPARPSLEDIARFYSGGNMNGPITFDWTNTMGTTGFAGSGNIRLNPKVKESLDAFFKYGPRSQQGMVLGALGLSTLIHESLHNRYGPTGYDWAADEQYPTDLGWRLLPDAMQRFFGVPLDSPWGRKWRQMVLKQLKPLPPGPSSG